jgi:Flp pilus assembly protein TadG
MKGNFWRPFIKDEKGNVIVLVALLLIVLLGMAALAVDVGQLYLVRRQMVNAADAAALAGAMETKDKDSRDLAEEYALINGVAANLFNQNSDVEITGKSNEGNRTVSVRARKQVDFTFARILPGVGPSTIVTAVASAAHGPGNGLVPFMRQGLNTCQCCACEEGDCTCEDTCEAKKETDPTHQCSFCCEVEGSNGWRIINENGKCASSGELVLKYEDNKQSEFGPGSYGYCEFYGMSGGNDIRYALAGGYDGGLENVAVGTIVDEGGGNKVGPLADGIATREYFAGDDPPKSIEDLPKNPYLSDMVIIIPLVTPAAGNKKQEIVGYASMLMVYDYENNKKYVYGYLIEYLTYADLERIYSDGLDGFVLRLIQVPKSVLTKWSMNY